MKKIITLVTISIITLTSSTNASDIDALTKAVVKIIKSQYQIQNRLTKIEKELRTKNTTSTSQKTNKELNNLYKKISILNKKIDNLSKNKTYKKTKKYKAKKTSDDKIIEDFLK